MIFMKPKFLFVLIVLLALTYRSYSQYTFGVSPGFSLNSAYFGYRLDSKFMPFIGFQYFNAKLKYNQSGVDDLSMNLSGTICVPNIGVKYYVHEQNKMKTYFSLSLSKPILSGKLESDNEEVEDFNNTIDNIGLWGAELGYGAEYFFDENFSLGGEFGLRYMHLKYSNTSNNSSDELKFRMSPTFSKISLNYYF